MSQVRNAASPERIAVGAVVQISDGAVQTSGVSIAVRGQGGASGAGAGTTAYDNGIVEYTPTQGETDFTSFVVIAYKTGCIPVSQTIITVPALQTGDSFARLGAPAGASVSADVAAMKVDTAAILADTGTDGVVVAAASKSGYSLTATTGLGNQTANITGNLSGSVGSVTGNVGGNITGSVGSLATQAKADVNAEVVDALNTDTYAEPGQGTPGATISLAAKIGYLYKAWRNRSTQTATTYSLYNDDAVTVDQKATVSDDATTADKGEVATGP